MRWLTMMIALALGFAAACGEHGNAARLDAGPPADAAVPGGPDAACFDNPQTYNEIINACTTAQKVYKDSHPPLLNPDGTLPALPP
jgi:hypothetical protein